MKHRDGFVPSSAEDLLRQRMKAELRKRLRGLRAALPASACAARSAQIANRLLELGAFARARSVALFWPIEERHEVDLRPLDASLRGRGVRVAYPAVDPDSGDMTLRFVSQPETMAPNALGFCEPSSGEPEAKRGDLDAIVVPAIAADPRGHRIGYGAGYYDRVLPLFAPPAVAIAVAFDFQLVVEIPQTDRDVAVSWLVTDARTLEAGP